MAWANLRCGTRFDFREKYCHIDYEEQVFPLSQSPAATVVESPSSPGPNPPASSFVSEAESDDAFGVEVRAIWFGFRSNWR